MAIIYYLVIKLLDPVSDLLITYSTMNNFTGGNFFKSLDLGDTWNAYDSRDILLTTFSYGDTTPPAKPSKIEGANIAIPGEGFKFSYATYTDPEGNDMFYNIDWGDGTSTGWNGPILSGYQHAHMKSKWNKGGFLSVRVKATASSGAESEWSDPLLVIVPKPKTKAPSFLNFLEQHPLMYPLIRQLRGLQ